MRPQTLTSQQITRLEATDTFLVHSSELEWGDLYTPTIFIQDEGQEREKFDFYKAYKNSKNEILHCEYRSTTTENKLIVHTL